MPVPNDDKDEVPVDKGTLLPLLLLVGGKMSKLVCVASVSVFQVHEGTEDESELGCVSRGFLYCLGTHVSCKDEPDTGCIGHAWGRA